MSTSTNEDLPHWFLGSDAAEALERLEEGGCDRARILVYLELLREGDADSRNRARRGGVKLEQAFRKELAEVRCALQSVGRFVARWPGVSVAIPDFRPFSEQMLWFIDTLEKIDKLGGRERLRNLVLAGLIDYVQNPHDDRAKEQWTGDPEGIKYAAEIELVLAVTRPRARFGRGWIRKLAFARKELIAFVHKVRMDRAWVFVQRALMEGAALSRLRAEKVSPLSDTGGKP